MSFASITFIFVFFPTFIVFYFASRKNFKNTILLLFSSGFYYYLEPAFCILATFSTLLDWLLSRWIAKTNSERIRKALLFTAMLANLGILLYFKYTNFLLQNISLIIPHSDFIHLTKIITPIGVSFILFEKITYIVDVYRREQEPESNFFTYLTYIFYFPKLLAGPIVRYTDIKSQLSDRSPPQYHEIFSGIHRFCIGLGKKVLIADTISVVSDQVFSLPMDQVSIQAAWIGALAFTVQIYFDFSGYSDMAIGISSIIGFKLKENFNAPYLSQNFTDFWSRWHISLSNWIRNYLYIPLGGNRVDKKRTYLNLSLCFLASGLWHGANWTFIVWGLYNGFFLILDRTKSFQALQKHLPTLVTISATFLLTIFGWVIFRSENIATAASYLSKMAGLHGCTSHSIQLTNLQWAALATGLGLGFTSEFWIGLVRKFRFLGSVHFNAALSFALLTVSVGKLFSSHFNPFLYFRF